MQPNQYQKHLDRVSRSFAFCIARLEGDLRGWVGLSYLLCRVLDTVEDAPWNDALLQDAAFEDFRNFLDFPPTAERVKEWAAKFPELPEGERLVLEDAFLLFRDLHALPISVSEKIRASVLNMYRGMRFFATQRSETHVVRLNSLVEVNQYCFFVAGLVGELLTDLIAELSPLRKKESIYVDAHHFGLFLQKVNLLKDQAKDELAGRFLVHSRKEVLASLIRDAEGALRYLVTLPATEKGYRLFCAWSLFLGLASLPWIESGMKFGVLQKIPRFFTEKLLVKVEKVIDDNHSLQRLFQEMIAAVPGSALPAIQGNGSAPWINDLYKGKLGEAEFARLGMLPLS